MKIQDSLYRASAHALTIIKHPGRWGWELPPCSWPHARAWSEGGTGSRGWQAYPSHHRGRRQGWGHRTWRGAVLQGFLSPEGTERKEMEQLLFPVCSSLAASSLAGLSPRLSTSLRAGRENKAAAKLANTLAKPINRSPWERWAHPRTVITNEKLQDTKTAFLKEP